MKRLNLTLAALMLSIYVTHAYAQPSEPQASLPAAADSSEVPQPPQGMTPADRKKWFSERFKEADADHDGKLTREEARAGMPEVYKRFDKLDTRKRGYVTERQVGAAWSKMIQDDMQKKNPIIN